MCFPRFTKIRDIVSFYSFKPFPSQQLTAEENYSQDTPFPTFCPIFGTLRLSGGNQRRVFVSLPERRNENKNRTTTMSNKHCVLSSGM